MRKKTWLAGLGLLAALSLLTACPPPPPRGVLYARIAPPAVRVEAIGVAPGADYEWVPGYYRWDGREYLWVAGHHERRPSARAHWVAGRWRHDRNGWYFVEGRWR